jgi:hypothetical protein
VGFRIAGCAGCRIGIVGFRIAGCRIAGFRIAGCAGCRIASTKPPLTFIHQNRYEIPTAKVSRPVLSTL